MSPYEYGYYETLYKLGFAMKEAQGTQHIQMPPMTVKGDPNRFKRPAQGAQKGLPPSAQNTLAAIPKPPALPPQFGGKTPATPPAKPVKPVAGY